MPKDFFRACLVLGLSKENMSRTAYGAPVDPHGTLRHRQRGGWGDGRNGYGGRTFRRGIRGGGGTESAGGGTGRGADQRGGDCPSTRRARARAGSDRGRLSGARGAAGRDRRHAGAGGGNEGDSAARPDGARGLDRRAPALP